ncbi:MAG: nitroreductase family protein, partial [Micropepsaceae bacterium]
MQFDEVVQGRRSTRGFKKIAVPKSLIQEVIGLAIRAPSSFNTQPWNFYVVAGEPLDKIRKGNTERNLAGVPASREIRVHGGY